MQNKSNSAPRPVSLSPCEVDFFRSLAVQRGLVPATRRTPRLRFALLEVGVLMMIGVIFQAVTR